MTYTAGSFDLAIIGAGHAGIEAALAAARMGLRVVVFTMNLDSVGNMPCNPCIGGTAKGHLAREIDTLGGEMGKAADAALLQSRMLCRSKGPAVQSLRAQVDRRAYADYMRHVLENQPNILLRQAEIVDLGVEDGAIRTLTTRLGGVYNVKAVILASGTYLDSQVILGETSYASGPDGLASAVGLADKLRQLGITLQRFKTGTPARLSANTINFDPLTIQPGDEPPEPFSLETDPETVSNKVVCHLTYTNANTHEIIRANLHRAPMYSGQIHGVGARYCPSIEDKVVRFADKERHQLFLEPMGLDCTEIYLQGMSSSMPEDVQLAMIRSVKGLEKAEIMRPAYAIEYECLDPTQLSPTLEFKSIRGLYGAGQFNGTSGYEEAAAQGLMAGINAALAIQGKEPLVLDRSTSYIGTLIDDLTTKGTSEPYRMMTSRSEYRLTLRQDNADARLTPIGYRLGLISEERYEKFTLKQQQIKDEVARIEAITLSPGTLNPFLENLGLSPAKSGVKLADLIKRVELDYDKCAPVDPDRPVLDTVVTQAVNIQIKYEGYIVRQEARIRQFKRTENRLIPEEIDYLSIRGLRQEAAQKLDKLRPRSIGQASRISGVSPADVSVLLIWLEVNG